MRGARWSSTRSKPARRSHQSARCKLGSERREHSGRPRRCARSRAPRVSRSARTDWQQLERRDVTARRRGARSASSPALRPVSASQIAWTWARTRSSLARSSCGGATCPETIRSGPAEEVLVVAVPARAERVHERGLPAAPGAAGALGVVGRRRRYVAQVDDVQRGDVDAQLHRRRAEQQRQPARRGSSPRAPRGLLARYLGGVLARLDALPAVGDRAVEVEKNGFVPPPSAGACGTRIGSWNGCGAVARDPAQLRCRHLVARGRNRHVGRPDDLDQAIDAQCLQQPGISVSGRFSVSIAEA